MNTRNTGNTKTLRVLLVLLVFPVFIVFLVFQSSLFVFHIHKLCIHNVVFAVFGFRIAAARRTVGAWAPGGTLCAAGLAGRFVHRFS
jgi:hypothetical protein